MTKPRLARAGVTLLALTLLSACGDSGKQAGTAASTGGGASPLPALTVASLINQAGPAVADASTAVCPVSYDLSAAAKVATLNGSVAPAATYPVTVEVSSTTSGNDGTMKAIAPAVAIQCDYQVGATKVMTYLLAATKTNSAISASMPQIAFYSEPTDLADFITAALAAKPGVPVIRKSGKAGIVKLNVTDGDGSLAVGIDPVDGVSAPQLTKLIETLARQAS